MEPTQLNLYYPPSFLIDNHIDSKGIRYFGIATYVKDNLYHCLANVNGALCTVEISVSSITEQKGSH